MEDDRLRSEVEEALRGGVAGVDGGGERGLLFDACPGKIDVEEEEQDTETNDGGLDGLDLRERRRGTNIKLVTLAHQRVM